MIKYKYVRTNLLANCKMEISLTFELKKIYILLIISLLRFAAYKTLIICKNMTKHHDHH